MQYRTILLSLNDEPRAPSVISAALSLADDKTHIIGLYAMPSVPPPQELIGAGEKPWLHEQLRSFENQSERIRKKFNHLCKDRSQTYEWCFKRPSFEASVADSVIEQGRAADLIITSRAAKNGWIDDVAERVAIESGRPLIMLPDEGDLLSIATEITIAWKSSKEATRAVFDALPLMRKSRRVRLLTLVEDTVENTDDASRAELVSTLLRYGIETKVDSIFKIESSIGDTILDYVTRRNQDLLVMGIYGHSRFREFFLGGASRDVLAHATIPVLLSH